MASNFLEAQLAEMQTVVSTGYASPFPSQERARGAFDAARTALRPLHPLDVAYSATQARFGHLKL